MAQVYAVQKGAAVPLQQVHCRDEAKELQELLERNHDLLPGDQIRPDDPCRWMLVKREMPVADPASGTDRWSIDLFLVDQFAIPTLVECKRFRDTRSRREVVGQMLEYAANGHHYWTKEQIQKFAEDSARSRGQTLDGAISALQSEVGDSLEEFLDAIENNLRQGQIRLVFFLEEAPQELKSIVEFLNRQTERTELLIVEARQYQSGDLRIVVPSLFGFTEEARLVKRSVTVSRPHSQWNEERYFEHAAEHRDAEQVRCLAALLQAGRELGLHVSWGTGKGSGSFGLTHPVLGRSVVTAYSSGDIVLNFKAFGETQEGEAFRDAFAAALHARSLEGLPQTVAGLSHVIRPADFVVNVPRLIDALREVTRADLG